MLLGYSDHSGPRALANAVLVYELCPASFREEEEDLPGTQVEEVLARRGLNLA